MSVVKEYITDKTKIRIHDDYIDKEEQKMTKEMIISMIVNFVSVQPMQSAIAPKQCCKKTLHILDKPTFPKKF